MVGARGFFGGEVAAGLEDAGIPVLRTSTRGGADARLDAEDAASCAALLAPRDVVVDAAGPFQGRSDTLLRSALAVGADVVDLSDAPEHAARVLARGEDARAAGSRLLPGCSSVSALSAVAIQAADVAAPRRLTGLLAPAARFTANVGTARSLLASVGRPAQVLAGGSLATRPGWATSRSVRAGEGFAAVTGHLFGTADPLLLPRSFPDLEEVEMYVTSHVLGLDAALGMAARFGWLRAAIDRVLPHGVAATRLLGKPVGILAYEVEDAGGRVHGVRWTGGASTHLVPVAPAVLAAAALARDEHAGAAGVVAPADQVDADALRAWLDARGVAFELDPG